jgi:hypothetical protein
MTSRDYETVLKPWRKTPSYFSLWQNFSKKVMPSYLL